MAGVNAIAGRADTMPGNATREPKSRPSISVVVPVFNGELTLNDLVVRLEQVLSDLTEDFELILVNDGSRDQSWQLIKELALEHSWIRGIDLMRNYGQHNALLAGIRQAHFEIIVTMDDDLQNPPEQIPKLIERLAGGFDVVYGTPIKQQHGLWRDIASLVTKLALQGVMGAETARYVSAFRAFRSKLCRAFVEYKSPYVSIDVLLTWGTTQFAAVPVRHDRREVGMSNYSLRKLVVHALNMMTGFSTWPLQLASMIGFGFTLLGLVVLLYVMGRYFLEGGAVPGFPFLASIIAIFSGAQLFSIGIMGEYLARMHYRTMERPTYAIREQVADQDS